MRKVPSPYLVCPTGPIRVSRHAFTFTLTWLAPSFGPLTTHRCQLVQPKPAVEETSNAMALDGIMFEGVSVRVRRPNDYNPAAAASLGPSTPNPNLNLAAIGLSNAAGGGGGGGGGGKVGRDEGYAVETWVDAAGEPQDRLLFYNGVEEYFVEELWPCCLCY